jgi:hypothetical protein
MQRQANGNMRTHKNEDPISVLLPSLNHFVVLFICGLGIHGEERT